MPRLYMLGKSAYERLLARREKTKTGCWEFTGCLTSSGYGQVRDKGKALYAHRVSYEHHFGDIGDMSVCHKCDNPKCFNPEHLFLATHKDNMRDMQAKGRNKGIKLMNGKNSRWESVRATAL